MPYCVCGVEKERPRAGSGIEAACCVAKERKPTNCCVRRAGGEAKKGILAFRRVEPGIASIGRWNNGFCHRWKGKAGNQERKEGTPSKRTMNTICG